VSGEYSFSTRTRVGFSDTDAQGIVYYGRYNPYFDLARVEYLRSLGVLFHEAGGEFVMRANEVEYLAPARFDDELEIHIRVSRIGRTIPSGGAIVNLSSSSAKLATTTEAAVYASSKAAVLSITPERSATSAAGSNGFVTMPATPSA